MLESVNILVMIKIHYSHSLRTSQVSDFFLLHASQTKVKLKCSNVIVFKCCFQPGVQNYIPILQNLLI